MQRLDGFTADGFGNPISGEIVDGDVVRIGNTERRYYAPAVQQAPEFPTLTGSQFLSMLAETLGFSRAEQLLKANAVIEALILKAVTIDRHSGNTPAAISYLQGISTNPLTNSELAQIETAWRAV
jgi:hypothetical protein